MGAFARGRAARQRFARRDMACHARQRKSCLNLKRRQVLPLEGKGDRSAVDEVHLKGIQDFGRVLPFAQVGGAKPIAAAEMDGGCLAAAGGGLEGFTPPHNFRRGQRLPTDKRHSPAPREAPGLILR